MPDQREAILSQYLAIALDVKAADITIKTAIRNRGWRANEDRPAIILLDGDEGGDQLAQTKGRAGMMRTALVTMRPELYIVLDERRLQNETVGESLNAYRFALSVALAEDVEMASLLGSNGKVVYQGCVTDLKSGSALTGQMRLDFAFTYLFVPA